MHRFCYKVWVGLLGVVLVLSGACSTRKNTAGNRFYHESTSYFNYYFNAKEAYKKGEAVALRETRYDYTRPLPLVLAGLPETSGAVGSDMGVVEDKCGMLIRLHSITSKPERKKGRLTEKERKFYQQSEYNKYARKSWLLMAKARLWRGALDEAKQSLDHSLRLYAGQEEGWESALWLARWEYLQGEYLPAEERLKGLAKAKGRPQKDKRSDFLFDGVYADLLLVQDRYTEALPYVERALVNARRGRERERVRMSLAYVKEKLGKEQEARDLYKMVVRKSWDYELRFNARLRMAALSEGRDSKGMARTLEKMARDVKNADYLDQIYYALGEMACSQGDTVKGLEYFTLSAQKSVDNATQKGISYLKLGDYHYAHGQYYPAAAMYDSALAVLPMHYPNYAELSSQGAVLRKLADAMETVRFEDSVQRVARMPLQERKALISQEIAKVQEAKRQAEIERQQAAQNRQFAMQNQYRNQSSAGSANSGGGWYFYNASMLSFGRQDFRLKWGDRKLEDDWRRTNKQQGGEAGDGETGDGAQSGKEALSNLSEEYYLYDLPLTDSAMAESDKRIEEAILVLGDVYRFDLEDAPGAAREYEQLPDRYPRSEKAPEALYRGYSALNEAEGAVAYSAEQERLKGRIVAEYPQSHYAKMLMNPQYLREQRLVRDTLEQLYGRAWEAWQAERRVEAQGLSAEGMRKAGEHHDYTEAFALLAALSSGAHPGGVEQLTALRSFVNRYPEGARAVFAKGVLAQAERNIATTGKASGMEEGRGEAAADTLATASSLVDESVYRYVADTVHWLMLLTPLDVDVAATRFALLSFYVDYDINMTLDMEFSSLSKDVGVLLARKFANAGAALAFLHALQKENPFQDLGFTPRYFVVTPYNYQAVKAEGSVVPYLAFYERYYRQKGE